MLVELQKFVLILLVDTLKARRLGSLFFWPSFRLHTSTYST